MFGNLFLILSSHLRNLRFNYAIQQMMMIVNPDYACHILYIGSGEVGGALVGLVVLHARVRVAWELVALHSGQPDHHHYLLIPTLTLLQRLLKDSTSLLCGGLSRTEVVLEGRYRRKPPPHWSASSASPALPSYWSPWRQAIAPLANQFIWFNLVNWFKSSYVLTSVRIILLLGKTWKSVWNRV